MFISEKCDSICAGVVAHDLCIGCGLCAGVCPQKTLEMRFNEFGEYVAVDVKGTCSKDCDICLRVCPFSDQVENEDALAEKIFADIPDIEHRTETGYYLSSLVGYSNLNGHRANGASGGLATWTLETLLKKDLVDFVACVSPAKEPDRLFKFVVCDTPEEVRGSSKSCYYPVETSEIVRHIVNRKGSYGVIGLPCVIKALRLAMQVHTKLRQRIKFLLGLVCGQAKSRFFAEYICSLGRGNPRHIKKITFRIKDNNRPASDYGLRFVCGNNHQAGKPEGTVFWTEGMDRVWCSRYFTPNACNYCDDLFSELADISFMDAWLPEYTSESAGTNLVIIRNPKLQSLFQKASEAGEIQVDVIDIESVIKSQRRALIAKRNDLAKRLAVRKKLKQQVPEKRVLPLGKMKFREFLKTYVEMKIMQKSKVAFLKQKAFGPGLEVFRRTMRLYRFVAYLLFKAEVFSGRVKRALFTR